ncbi:MAG TPA: flagellar biosynthesis protein FlhB [Syntrophales bacterium]|nr:flagellar biosynthesis protein FlhB [Syntrophales bacterium]
MSEKDEGQEKTEQSTPKRRDEAREKGQVARSREVSSAAMLLACLIYFYFNATGMLEKLMAMMASSFKSSGQTAINMDNVQFLLTGLLFKVFFLLLPLLLVVSVAAILSNIIQVGVIFSPAAMRPELDKISPIKGFQKLFSLRSLVELIKNSIKMFIVGFIAYLVIKKEIGGFLPLAEQGAGAIVIYMGKISFKILLNTCWVLILLAILDYLYQRWEYEKGLRMSRQEIKDEFKNSEGDPAIRARIKNLQRAMARKRMMAAVPKADVVITNPTHLAVALRYEQEKTIAPCVVAKGAGLIAEKIREVAKSANVPIVENKPLAQVLCKMVKVNDLIPETLYRAVAEVLAYVYNLRKN